MVSRVVERRLLPNGCLIRERNKIMDSVVIFCILSLLLVIGKCLRTVLPLLQRLYLPSSIIGGVIGLALLSVFTDYISASWVAAIRSVPGFLINVIFATLFLGKATPAIGKIWRLALPQLCMGQMLGWGQYVIGLGLAGLIFVPMFGVPAAFGNLLEIGFEGGHGTVGGMAESFVAFDWGDGIALGYTMATVGMILGIVLGMVLVNWALRKGHIANVQTFKERERHERIGVYEAGEQPSAGRQTVVCDSIDSLAWHLALIGLAVFIGFLILKVLQMGEIWCLPDVTTRLFKGFPLFPLCMIGGVLIQKVATKLKCGHLVDHEQMQRLSGAALDYLVVAAVATIKLSVVADHWQPLLILIVAGAAWSWIMVVYVAPRLYKSAWFECAIAEFGQSLGVTATGLMLLRTVDPENKTVAAASFGYKQLFHEPIMGGGLWTAFALTLVYNIGWLKVWLFSCVVLACWIGVSLWIIRKNRTEAAKE